jgi:predicted nucleic acid-binding protein
LKAVSNSSVLIALGAIEQLGLLQQRFPDGIFVPIAVWQEVVETGSGRPGAQAVATASFIQVQPIANVILASFLQNELDYGESEAIALFIENPLNALLLDEKSARQVARRMNLPILGTVGILIWAKQQGLIDSLKEQLDRLMSQGQFRLSQRVYGSALQKVGEG